MPSHADISLTKHVKEGLGILDIRLLDHFIVCGNQFVSFVEKGFI
jgi:DNA repair proteins